MKNVIYLFLLFFIFESCKKKENYDFSNTIQGYAIDFVSKDSVPNTIVEIWEDDRGGSNLLTDYDRKIAETITDEYGHFTISFNGSMIKGYCIAVNKYPYLNNPSVDLVNDITKNINPYLIPLSWMKIHIQNITPSDPDDSIFFAPNVNQKGVNVDTTFFRQFRTTDTQIDYWDITINGTTTRSSQITNCTPFDTCQLNIVY